MARTDVPLLEAPIVYPRSGGSCAFPGCKQELVEPGTAIDKPAFLGKIAHIVADSRDGPRGDHPMTDEDRDKHPNLILLCGVHHDLIDIQKFKYSVSVLRQLKADHEGRIRKAAAPTTPEPNRSVVWEPKRRTTGEGKGFWWHLGRASASIGSARSSGVCRRDRSGT